jgi:hypothetical protein
LLSKQFSHLVGAGIGYVILTTKLPTTELELALSLNPSKAGTLLFVYMYSPAMLVSSDVSIQGVFSLRREKG